MTGINIPWAQPDYWGNEREYLLHAFDSSWISGGEFVDKLESYFVKWTLQSNGLAVSNGTSSLHLAFLGTGIGVGDEVIVPGFCFLAAANIALQMGAKPIFAEVDPDTWCITPESILETISSRTKAVVPVHTYGNACRIDEIVELCNEKNIYVIEDAAESLGTLYKGKLTGTFGDIGCFSFQATKTITTGEGGMVVTNNEVIAEKMKLNRNHGMSKRRYWHEVAGNNFRLTNLQAALGCAQFEQLEKISLARKKMDHLYRDQLEDIEGVTCQFYPSEVNAVVWAIAIKLSPSAFSQGRDKVMSEFLEAGIETRPGFYAATLMTHIYGENIYPLPHCLELSQQIISLPSSPTLSEEEIIYVCNTLNSLRR